MMVLYGTATPDGLHINDLEGGAGMSLRRTPAQCCSDPATARDARRLGGWECRAPRTAAWERQILTISSVAFGAFVTTSNTPPPSASTLWPAGVDEAIPLIAESLDRVVATPGQVATPLQRLGSVPPRPRSEPKGGEFSITAPGENWIAVDTAAFWTPPATSAPLPSRSTPTVGLVIQLNNGLCAAKWTC